MIESSILILEVIFKGLIMGFAVIGLVGTLILLIECDLTPNVIRFLVGNLLKFYKKYFPKKIRKHTLLSKYDVIYTKEIENNCGYCKHRWKTNCIVYNEFVEENQKPCEKYYFSK